MINNRIEDFSQQNDLFCKYCGGRIKADSQFCPSCGHPVMAQSAKTFCFRCGGELDDSEMFCHHCGAPTTQNRDAQAINNITQYNDSLVKKKAPKIAKIKNNSVFASLAWIATAGIAGLASCMLAENLSYGGFSSIGIIFELAVAVLFVVSTVTGIFLWKNDKKTRVIPVIAFIIGKLPVCLLFLKGIFGPDILFALSFIITDVVALLFATGVIKTKKTILSLTILSVVVTIVLPMVFARSLVAALIMLGGAIPSLLLSFSFTSGEEKPTTKKKTILKNCICMAIAFLLVLGGTGIGLHLSWVYVGDMSNMKIEDAQEDCERLYLQIKYKYDSKVEKGLVISQSIEKKTFVHPGNDIILTVSKGEGVAVPKVANLTVAKAKAKLKKVGLTAKVKYAYNAKVAKGRVIKASAKRVDEGAAVTLIVSKGKDTRIKVPDVLYLSEYAAKTKLQNKGFKVSVTYVYESCDAYEGNSKVIFQSLTGKQEKGSIVRIQVTKPSLDITNVNFDINSAGGVDVNISFRNTSPKTIKYITFTTRFKNAVGDDVYCEIRSTSSMNLEYTGPLYSGGSDYASWDAVIYNWNCDRIYFDEINVEFMDGTTHSMTYNGYWY